MAANARELIEVTVWGDKDLATVSNEVREILDVHVAPIIMPGSVITELTAWASEQLLVHNEKGSKIQTTIDNTPSLDCTGVIKLRNHHWMIAHKYRCVAMELISLHSRIYAH